jgi:hypothetical protein
MIFDKYNNQRCTIIFVNTKYRLNMHKNYPIPKDISWDNNWDCHIILGINPWDFDGISCYSIWDN